MQRPAEPLRRQPLVALAMSAAALTSPATSPATAATGRVVYIGKPFPHWPDIRRCLVDRNLEVSESGDSHEQLLPDALALADLVIVGENDGPRDAHEICADIRRLLQRIPILLMTNASDAVSRILGLENGADAWAAADADARSSVAQIRALLRRETLRAMTPVTVREASTLRAGEFVMNYSSRQAAISQKSVELTAREFELLWNLVKHAGQVLSRERLAQLIGYRPDMLGGRAIDTLVGRLRHRVGSAHARQIRSIRAVGYMLCTGTLPELSADASPSNH